MNINIKDNVFHEDDYQYLVEYSRDALYVFGEGDRPSVNPTGMVHNIDLDTKITKLIHKRMQDTFPKEIAKYDFPDRVYINCFAPREDAYYHVDGERDPKLV